PTNSTSTRSSAMTARRIAAGSLLNASENTSSRVRSRRRAWPIARSSSESRVKRAVRASC
ncbi:hypothetical protein M3553_22260, partial [Bacillus subtilis]|nr:hypothetical protein [Bacillus subtilis]